MHACRGEGEEDTSTERLNLVGAQRESRGVDLEVAPRTRGPSAAGPCYQHPRGIPGCWSRQIRIPPWFDQFACLLAPPARMVSRACAWQATQLFFGRTTVTQLLAATAAAEQSWFSSGVPPSIAVAFLLKTVSKFWHQSRVACLL
jgi:hypothetical protein